MSIELKQAAQQAIEAIQDLRGYRPDIDKAIEALRAAIQQAESEPVAGQTTYQQRFTEVVSLLCRAAPPAWFEQQGCPANSMCGPATLSA